MWSGFIFSTQQTDVTHHANVGQWSISKEGGVKNQKEAAGPQLHIVALHVINVIYNVICFTHF